MTDEQLNIVDTLISLMTAQEKQRIYYALAVKGAQHTREEAEILWKLALDKDVEFVTQSGM